MAVDKIKDVVGSIAAVRGAIVDAGIGDAIHTADVLVHCNWWSTVGTLMFQKERGVGIRC